MKVVTASTMAKLESIAYKEGCKEETFMERAGLGISLAAQSFVEEYKLSKSVLLLCGKGNNGGDAFVAGCYLLEAGYEVHAAFVDTFDNCSPLCKQNGKRFLEHGGQLINNLSDFFSYSFILDGIFGTGFKGVVQEPYASLIQAANKSGKPILAIDIPSGLNGSTGDAGETVIHAEETIFLDLPKTGFFLQQGWNYVGRLLRFVDFGLPVPIIDKAQAEFNLITELDAKQLLPPIKRNRHKYQAGLVMGLAGSPSMPGAAMLSSLAALRGGCGIVKLLYPQGMEAELAASPYELIKIPYTYDKPQEVQELLQKGNASFVGPGLGLSKSAGELLNKVIPSLEKPCVIDADALTLFANGSFKKPHQAIFTPHLGEMQRLLHRTDRLELNLETLKLCQQYAEENELTLILKGAPTFIFHPGTLPLVNPTGDPGMATAGSGDVLTGLLASLLAQGLDCRQAATLGVYLHGLSGEHASAAKTPYSLIAGDLISHLPNAFYSLEHADQELS